MKFKYNFIFFFICLLFKNSKQICNVNNCPSDSGECIGDICLCAAGYTTLKNYKPYGIFNFLAKPQKKFCNYPLIYKDWAIYFELFVPMGLGHFYARRYLHAAFKFALFWYLSFANVIFKKKIRAYPNLQTATKFLMWFFVFHYVLDYFGFNFGIYLDGYKMEFI